MKTNIISCKYNDVIVTTLLVSGLWLAASMLPTFAADFTVNDASDAVDLNPGDGSCEVTLATGDCTLRAAVMETNALAGADSIALPIGTYELTLNEGDELCENPAYYTGAGTATECTGDGTEGSPYLPTITSDASKGDLDINDDLTITGAGVGLTIIQWAVAAADDDPLSGDRIFHIAVAAGATANITSVVIQDLSVTNGQVGLIATVAADVCIDDGEGNLIYTPANLNAYDIDDTGNNDTACTNNTIALTQFRRMGGAIAQGAGYAVVTYEEAIHGPDAPSGGGVDMGPFPGGKPGEEEGYSIENISLNRVAVINNWAGADGGGIYSAVPATFNQVAISGNTSNANGGGIYNDATLSVSGSLIGKVFDADTMALFPELTNPNVGENGGAIFDTGAHTTIIAGSAINGNEAIGGGGIAARAGITVNIDNSTVSSNTGTDVGGGITTNGTVNLRNVTVTNNVATTDAPGGGGGLNSFGGGNFNFNNTLLANNTVSGRAVPLANCGCSGGSATCKAGVMTSGFYNIEDGDSCSLSMASGTDLLNTDPMLLALADNGGFTETHALVSGSPAVDQGFQVLCDQLVTDPWGAFDQRGSGFSRVLDGDGDLVLNCDRGAYEAPAVTPDPVIPVPVLPTFTSSGGGGLCSYNPNAEFDLVLPAIVFIALGYLGWRRNEV